ncbi:MAG: cystathionine beta-lyase [Burkholderiales bacterium]|nr:MAG: cystathionine beta-lyase [Burkholderiales bacterium]
MQEDRFATRLAEAGRDGEATFVAANVAVHRASTVLFDTLEATGAAGAAVAEGRARATTYGTVGTPTTMALMDALCEIEGGGHAVRASLMPSGLAAITTALLAVLSPGDHLLVADSSYGPTRVFCDGMLARMGVRTSYYDPTIGAGIAALLRPETKLIWLESPGSYTFEVQDVPAICAIARERGIVTMIDNTWASPIFARPFDWGVDASVLALTKYWGGHSDVLMGAVVVRESLWPKLWAAVRQLGQCASGDDAWLVLRGLRSAEVRMRRHEANALEVARWLEARPEVASVLHPALPSHPQHALWRRDFSGASGLFSFELDRALVASARADGHSATAGDAARASERERAALAALCERRRHFAIGYSWGGFESLVMPAHIDRMRSAKPWTGGPLVRLHVGLEDPADLIADLAEGFEAMGRVLAASGPG